MTDTNAQALRDLAESHLATVRKRLPTDRMGRFVLFIEVVRAMDYWGTNAPAMIGDSEKVAQSFDLMYWGWRGRLAARYNSPSAMLPNTAMKPTVETLALEFSQGLQAYLTPEQMSEVVERNKNEANPHICHSHDFCDANMVLYDVFKKYGMDPAARGGIDKWADLWNSAWNLAKARCFRTTE